MSGLGGVSGGGAPGYYRPQGGLAQSGVQLNAGAANTAAAEEAERARQAAMGQYFFGGPQFAPSAPPVPGAAGQFFQQPQFAAAPPGAQPQGAQRWHLKNWFANPRFEKGSSPDLPPQGEKMRGLLESMQAQTQTPPAQPPEEETQTQTPPQEAGRNPETDAPPEPKEPKEPTPKAQVAELGAIYKQAETEGGLSEELARKLYAMLPQGVKPRAEEKKEKKQITPNFSGLSQKQIESALRRTNEIMEMMVKYLTLGVF